MYKSIIALLCVGASIASCSKAKPDPTPLVTPPVKEHQVDYIAKIEELDKADNKKYFELVFSYDKEQRLTSFVERYLLAGQEIEGKLNYTSTAISLDYAEHKYQENLTQATHYKLSLDAQKRAEKLEQSIYFTDEIDFRREEGYTYDQEGHLLTYSSPFFSRAQLTWQSGKLTQAVYTREEGYQQIQDRTYTTIANNSYPDLNLYLKNMVLSPTVKYLWARELGLRSTHLIQSATLRRSDNKETSEASYQYELDSKGRPARITANYGNKTSLFLITYVNP